MDLDEYEGLPRFDLFLRRADPLVEIPFSFALVRPADGPERVDGRNFLAGGSPLADAFTARPRPTKKK
jgi:hypothetical protein